MASDSAIARAGASSAAAVASRKSPQDGSTDATLTDLGTRLQAAMNELVRIVEVDASGNIIPRTGSAPGVPAEPAQPHALRFIAQHLVRNKQAANGATTAKHSVHS